MNTDFIITGISPEKTEYLFSMDKEELAELGMRSCHVDSYPGFPCRVSLEDVPIGEEVMLLTYEHHSTSSPYRASGPVFIRKNAIPASLEVNAIPEMLNHRFLSLRVYDKDGMMLGARTAGGGALKEEIAEIFNDPDALYIQLHNAGPGCYNCTVYRAI